MPAKKKCAMKTAKSAKSKKYVYLFGPGRKNSQGNASMKNLLGGKGANVSIGLAGSGRIYGQHGVLRRLFS